MNIKCHFYVKTIQSCLGAMGEYRFKSQFCNLSAANQTVQFFNPRTQYFEMQSIRTE